MRDCSRSLQMQTRLNRFSRCSTATGRQDHRATSSASEQLKCLSLGKSVFPIGKTSNVFTRVRQQNVSEYRLHSSSPGHCIVNLVDGSKLDTSWVQGWSTCHSVLSAEQCYFVVHDKSCLWLIHANHSIFTVVQGENRSWTTHVGLHDKLLPWRYVKKLIY